MNKLCTVLCLVIGTALFAVSVVVSFMFLSLKRQEVANEARFQCAQSSRYQVTQANGTVVWYPVEELNTKCLKEKGL
jgi:hypothetical protein